MLLAEHPRSDENERGALRPDRDRDRRSVWCHESAREFDPSIPRHPSLLPLAIGEHAGEILMSREARRWGRSATGRKEASDASQV